MSHPFRLLHRLRQREIVPARDDFASALLFQFATGVAGKMEFQTNALSPALSPQERVNHSPTMCRSNAPGCSKSHEFDNMEAATAILTDDFSRNAIMLSLSSEERAGVRASVSTFINLLDAFVADACQPAFERLGLGTGDGLDDAKQALSVGAIQLLGAASGWNQKGGGNLPPFGKLRIATTHVRSEERRVGKECRSRWSPYH